MFFFYNLQDPIMEFEVESHFEGRPVPQITSLIVNQVRVHYSTTGTRTCVVVENRGVYGIQTVVPPN